MFQKMQYGIRVYSTMGDAYKFFEIQLFEDGKDEVNKITNVKIQNKEETTIGLSWDATDDVTETKIYKDGIFVGKTSEREYVINSGLMSNTEYLIYLEPITAETTDNVTNRKTIKVVTTAKNGVDFYVEGDKISKKRYTNLLDKDLGTFINFPTDIIIRWNQNADITDKLALVKTYGGDGNENFAIQYIDSQGDTINAYTSAYVKSNYMNFKSDESLTYVPENAVRNKSMF